MSETIEPGTALAILPRAALPTILAADDKDIFGKLFAELSDFEPDASTPKGREEIGSKALKVGKAKMDLVRLANSLTEDWRAKTTAVVAERKIIEERMDELRKRIEAPRDEYNAREKRRVEAHEAAIEELFDRGTSALGRSSAEIAQLIDEMANLHSDRNWEEFASRADKARAAGIAGLRGAYEVTKTSEDEAEAARVNAHQDAIAALHEFHQIPDGRLETANELRLRLDRFDNLPSRDWEEFADDAASVRATVRQILVEWVTDAEAQEAEARRLREEQIATEAAEQARLAAERRAQRADYHRRMLQHVKSCGFGFIDEQPQPYGILQYELTDKIKYDEENFGNLLPEALIARDEALGMIQRGIDATARRHAEQEAAAERERVAAQALADAAERERKAEADRIERERVIAERERLSAQQAEAARIAAVEKAEADRLAAVEAERRRVAREAAAQKAEDERRAADTAHRTAIDRETALDLQQRIQMPDGRSLPKEVAQAIIKAVFKGEIRHMVIDYVGALEAGALL